MKASLATTTITLLWASCALSVVTTVVDAFVLSERCRGGRDVAPVMVRAPDVVVRSSARRDGGGDDDVVVVPRRSLRDDVARTLAATAVSLGVALVAATTTPLSARAADYGSLSSEQKSVAEAWRVVDGTFLDRTFNGQDWFKLRQDAVKKKYKNVDEARAAVSELVGSLGDKYTRYLPPDKYRSIVDSATGTLAGIGVQIAPLPGSDGNRAVVGDVEDDSPASRGGLRAGDVFVEVDGVQCDGVAPDCSPDAVAQRVRGPVGSRVGVTVERGDVDAKERLDAVLTRATIKVTSVKSYASGRTGVVRIKSFSGTTAATVKEAVETLKQRNKNLENIVIDLRANPGGLLPGGVETASLFLRKDAPVVFVVSKTGVVDAQYALDDGIDLDDPVVVLVDGGTASAAEVFTAALRENGRATVVGAPGASSTFGKGVVQTIRELDNDNGGVAVTVARYETPNRNDINKKGVPVDVEIDGAKYVEACGRPNDAVACVPPSAFQPPSSTASAN